MGTVVYWQLGAALLGIALVILKPTSRYIGWSILCISIFFFLYGYISKNSASSPTIANPIEKVGEQKHQSIKPSMPIDKVERHIGGKYHEAAKQAADETNKELAEELKELISTDIENLFPKKSREKQKKKKIREDLANFIKELWKFETGYRFGHGNGWDKKSTDFRNRSYKLLASIKEYLTKNLDSSYAVTFDNPEPKNLNPKDYEYRFENQGKSDEYRAKIRYLQKIIEEQK